MEEGTKHDIDHLMKKLKRVVKLQNDSNDESDIIQILDFLLEADNTLIEENTEFTVDDDFLSLLTHKSSTVVAKTAKLIAEIARTEEGRKKCTHSNVAKTLMALLNQDDIDVLTQTSRALGNICYENVLGNQMVQDNDGVKYILEVLQRAVNLKNAEGAEFLRNVVAGFLLNYLDDQKALLEQALDQGLLPILCEILEIDGLAGGKSAMHVLLILEILNDNAIEFLDERLTKILKEILANDTSTELSEMCLELFHSQAEYENAKVLLAKAGVCELLLKLLEKHVPRCTDEESRSVLKVACNLIVLIVTGDESMNLLYDDSKGNVYRKLVEWLEYTSSDEDLQLAAVLAMGNFARSDAHCKEIVSQGVHKHLLRLLQKNNTNKGDIRFQYALLSAVRNLVIPPANKSVMLNDGLIDVVYPMLDIPTFPVVFKLLGTLRIVIDGQRDAARCLGTREDLIKRVVDWCTTEDHPGVQGEANRLIAWLVTNCPESDVVSLMIRHGAIEHLVKMITGPHALMQNEAIASLAIICAMSLQECEPVLNKSEIHVVLRKFFDTAKALELPVIENAMTLALILIKSDTLKDQFKQSHLMESLETLNNSKKLHADKYESLKNLLIVNEN